MSRSVRPQRDAAAHSPVAMVVGDPIEFIARHFHGNPQARTLKGKKLLDEFRLCRSRAKALYEYARVLRIYMQRAQLEAFPQRPAWPERQNKKTDE